MIPKIHHEFFPREDCINRFADDVLGQSCRGAELGSKILSP